jgi:chorismate mutase
LESIFALRKRIDEIDEKILHLLKERVEACRSIGAAKRENRMPVRDYKRETEVDKHAMIRASETGLDQHDAKAVYQRIVAMCIHAQQADLRDKQKK